MDAGAGEDDYEYDVFISYAGGGAIAQWVCDVFRSEFELWLRDEIKDVRVFFDKRDIPHGTEFPAVLQRAHQRSKVLVAVLSPAYFQSQWCMTELFSMLGRHDPSSDDPRSFVHPVAAQDCFNLGEIDPDLADLQNLRFEDHPTGTGRPTKRFKNDIRQLAVAVADSIEYAPAWRSDFPIIERPPIERKRKRPRFGDRHD